MKAISKLPKRGAPISPAVGVSWHSGRGLALANAISRQQSWVRKLVVRWMPDWICGSSEECRIPCLC